MLQSTLVNNAGHRSIGIAEAFSEEQIDSQFQVNSFAPMRMTKAVLAAMRQSRSGLIVHVSFVVGRVLFLEMRLLLRQQIRPRSFR